MILNLSYFLAVSKCKSITAAARKLYLSQPAMSSAILRLEKKLGCTLFDRSNKELELTPEGRCVEKYAMEICDLYEKMLNELKLIENQAKNTIRLGSGLRHVVNIMDNFVYSNPDVNMLLCQYSNYYDAKRALLDHEIDICISSPPLEGIGIHTESLCVENLYVLFNKVHPFRNENVVPIEVVATSKLVVQPSGFPLRVIIDKIFSTAGLVANYVMQAENNAIVSLLQESRTAEYTTIYPGSRWLELNKICPDILCRPIDCKPTREIAVSWLERTTLTPQLDALIQMIRAYYSTRKYSSFDPQPRLFSASFTANGHFNSFM